MTTWLVFVTVRSIWGRPATEQAAEEIQADLTRRAGRTGEPGIDPEAAHLHGDHIRIRQSFPHVTAFQAVMLAGEALRRTVKDEDIVRIETITLDEWQRMGGR